MPSFEDKRYRDRCIEGQSPKSSSSVSSFTSEEKEELSKDLRRSYEFSSVEKLLEFCFEKKSPLTTFYYHPNNRGLPEKLYSSEKWTDEELGDFQKLKRELNTVKNKLNDYNLNDWHRYTRATNPADLVMRRLRDEMKVEFLTQAWCKFYELVSEFNLIPSDARKTKELYSIHLCEAPGAFVASLNHFLKSNYPDMKWYWMANSLDPFYEGNTLSQMINDDRFMMQTLKNWCFGPDLTGDITHPDFPEYLAGKCGNRGAHLVTADGSIDCQDNPDEQESTVSWLHLKETLTALRVLREGGHFVIKMFTFFECETICLMYLLHMLFVTLQVMKPATSKEGNSEVYVVCREFRGAEAARPYLEQLGTITEEIHKKFPMFTYRDIDRRFMIKLKECAKEFVGNQISVIERNIKLFDYRHSEELQRHFEFAQLQMWQKFVDIYKVKPIPRTENIVPLPRKRYFEARKRTNVMEKRERRRGSHAQQIMRKSLSKDEVFANIMKELCDLESVFRGITHREMPCVNIPINDFEVVRGKPIETVRSSQFCHGTLIRMRNEIIDTITIGKYNKFSQCRDKYDHKKRDDLRICDFRETFCNYDNYSEAQLRAFLKVYGALRELNNYDDLVFIGFPLLTRFNISLLCFLQQFFYNIEWKAPFVLYMQELNLKKLQRWGPKLDDIHKMYSKNRAVLSFLPLDYLITEPLYSWLVEVNNTRVFHEFKLLIDCKTQVN